MDFTELRKHPAQTEAGYFVVVLAFGSNTNRQRSPRWYGTLIL